MLSTLMSFSQDADLRDAYIRKSRNLRTSGFITLGCGSAALITGVGILSQTQAGLEYLDQGLTGAGLAIVGAACVGVSIILFATSRQYEKRADRISLQLGKPITVNTGINNKVLPYSVGLKFSINN